MVDPFGLRGEIYLLPPGTVELPKFEKLKSIGAIYTSALNIPARDFLEGFPGVTDRFEWFAIDYTGHFYIDNPGKYRFLLGSDDGSKLYIDNRRIIDNDGIHPIQYEEASITLKGGIHSIRISYFQGPPTGIGPGSRCGSSRRGLAGLQHRRIPPAAQSRGLEVRGS